jgi:serine/threonine-protein kinase
MTYKSKGKIGAVQAPEEDDESTLLLDNRYRIIRLLGEGGMGSVHLAEHVGLNKRVAVKFLHLELAGQDDVVKRFDQEAKVAASIRHKNIIEVYDVGLSADGDPFLVMEYLEGESLASLMKRSGPMDVGAACAVMEPTLLALAAANRQGIIHRDLKPENIFLAHQPDEPPVVKIIDFGLSKITTSSPDMSCTQTGSILGTPAYMSPEQARGAANIDHRADLYSLGTMLFEMLTGALPYSGNNFTEFFAKLLTEEPRAPRDVYPGFPVEAEPILRKALSKSPDERFQSASEMLEALKTLSGFDKRDERLALLSSSMGKSTFAAGDLGQGGVPSVGGRRRTVAASTRARRVSNVASRAIDNPQDATGEVPRRSRNLILAGVVGALLAAVLVLVGAVIFLRKGNGSLVSSPQSKALAEPPIPAPPPAAKLAPPPLPVPAPVAAVPAVPAPVQAAQVEPEPATRGKTAGAGSKRLRRGGRGTEMSEQFE